MQRESRKEAVDLFHPRRQTGSWLLVTARTGRKDSFCDAQSDLTDPSTRLPETFRGKSCLLRQRNVNICEKSRDTSAWGLSSSTHRYHIWAQRWFLDSLTGDVKEEFNLIFGHSAQSFKTRKMRVLCLLPPKSAPGNLLQGHYRTLNSKFTLVTLTPLPHNCNFLTQGVPVIKTRLWGGSDST